MALANIQGGQVVCGRTRSLKRDKLRPVFMKY